MRHFFATILIGGAAISAILVSAGSAEARGSRQIWNGAYRWQYSNNRAYNQPHLPQGNSFVQLGAHPALGGVRSLPGWSGAR
jgi:hypothetical protein